MEFFSKSAVLLFLIIEVASVSSKPQCEPRTNIRLHSGTVCGLTDHEATNNKTIYKYLGMLFGEPPVGNLRFQKPLPARNVSGIYNATEFGPSCMQSSSVLVQKDNLSEDCLYLNVYTPDPEALYLKPVMIWIHGGGYSSGTASFFDGTVLSSVGDVVIVTVNYRLGMFGFLSTGDVNAPGNYGLWDQILALEWVKRNIALFGGHPDNITIFGESAGGYSVGLLSLIPQARGLFKRVISQSGTSFCDRSLAPAAVPFSKEVAKRLSCPSDNHNSMLRCLRDKPSDGIVRATKESLDAENVVNLIRSIGPVIDSDLLQDQPKRLLKSDDETLKYYQKLDIKTGALDLDGAGFAVSVAKNLGVNVSNGIPWEIISEKILPIISKDWFSGHEKAVQRAFTDNYFKNQSSDIECGKALADLYTDGLFFGPTIQEMATRVNKPTQGLTYLYLFTFDSPSQPTGLPSWLKGPRHAWELSYLWGGFKSLGRNITTPAQKRVSESMMKLWIDFARTGNPSASWAQFTVANLTYVNINDPVSYRNLKDDLPVRATLWLETLPKLVEKDNGDNTNGGVGFVHSQMTVLSICVPFILSFCSFCGI